MISDACYEFIETKSVNYLVSEISRYLSDTTFSRCYTGDIRIRCQWIISNYSDFNEFLNRDPTRSIKQLVEQVKILIHLLDQSFIYV